MQHYYYLKLWTALRIQHANELCLLSAEWSRSFPHTTQGPRTFLAFTSSLHYLSVKTSLSKEVRLLLEQRSGWINGLNQQYDRNKRDTIKEWPTNLSVPEGGDLNYSTNCLPVPVICFHSGERWAGLQKFMCVCCHSWKTVSNDKRRLVIQAVAYIESVNCVLSRRTVYAIGITSGVTPFNFLSNETL